ncbi:MAG: transporter substrate-binding domain-containing protein, partial [Paraglaciecola sp.]|nr:transporter substrate-binding domain-containing protein [Paraglaciecola sp.]
TGLDITSEKFGPYEIIIHEHAMGNERHMQEMKKGELVNARVGITTFERESSLITIKIPIRRGLLNYRLLLVNKSELSKFEGIETLEQLTKLKVGLVDRWITSDILQHHNFNLLRIPDFESLMRMLMAKRYDFTVRGVSEIYTELDLAVANGADYAVVPNLGLYINSPTYLFISKRYPKLAKRIETGFELMLKNGQFQQIFFKWYQKSIDRANLKTRKFINLENPLLPFNTPTDRKELWFQAQID